MKQQASQTRRDGVGSDARDRRLSWSPRDDNDERDRHIGPRAVRQKFFATTPSIIATPAQPGTTVRLIPGFRWLHSCSFHDSAGLGGHLFNAGGGKFDCRCVATISLVTRQAPW